MLYAVQTNLHQAPVLTLRGPPADAPVRCAREAGGSQARRGRARAQAFIQWGQWAATRPDLFPGDLCAELARLHTGAPRHGFAHTRAAVEGAFRRPLAELFDEFDAAPVASGSIAQVHRAVLSARGASGSCYAPGARPRARLESARTGTADRLGRVLGRPVRRRGPRCGAPIREEHLTCQHPFETLTLRRARGA